MLEFKNTNLKVSTRGRAVKTESQYDFPALIFHAEAEKGKSNKAEFNEKAMEELSLSQGDHIVFYFDYAADGRLFVQKGDAETTHLPTGKRGGINADYSFTVTKPLFEALTETYDYAILRPITNKVDEDGNVVVEGQDVVCKLVNAQDNVYEVVAYTPDNQEEPSDEQQKADSQEEEYVEQAAEEVAQW